MAKASTKKTTTKKAPLRKRARTKKGHYIADDPGTPENEAYEETPEETPSIKKYIGIGIGVLLIALAVLGS